MKMLVIISLFAFIQTTISSASTTTKSSWNEVKSMLESEDIPRGNEDDSDIILSELSVYQDNRLPHYEVTANKFFKRIGLSIKNLIFDAAERTLNEHADYYPRIEKLLHPNGICFDGQWIIDQKNQYSGLFKHGAKALIIARASVAMTDTKSGDKRAFGLALKIFPTLNKDETVQTANMFAMNNLAGDKAKSFFTKALTNNPTLGIPALDQLMIAFHVGKAFKKADSDPSFRPVTPLAAAGELENRVNTPKWIKIEATETTKMLAPATKGLDFREELDSQFYPQGIQFSIAVSDETNNPKSNKGWTTIGALRLTNSITSYGCDRRLHFPHPKLKD